MRPLMISILLAVSLGVACSQRHNDEQIAKDIQNKIATDPDTKDSQVNVASKDGKVTLSGQVATPAAQQKAEQIAHQEPGATALDDQTTVAPSAMAAAPPAAGAMAAPPAAMAAPTPAPSPRKAAPEPAAPAEPKPIPKPQPIVIPAGTVITITTSQALSSKTSQTGQTFVGSLNNPVSVGGKTVIPKGADVSGTIVAAKEQGKIKGEGELDLALTSIVARGQTFPVKTEVVSNTSKSKGKRTAVTTGGGAAGGALIGGIAGGGKGAAIGALAGGGAGLAGGALTGNKPIEIPAESVLSFTLSAPLTLPPPDEAGGTAQHGSEHKQP